MVVIVAVGISAGVYLNFSAGVDVRSIEAQALYEKIESCFVNNGILLKEVMNKDFDIYDFCNLKEDVLENGDFYFRIRFLDEGLEVRDEIKSKKNVWDVECEAQKKENGKKVDSDIYPKCYDNRKEVLVYLENDFRILEIDILAASNSKGQRLDGGNL